MLCDDFKREISAMREKKFHPNTDMYLGCGVVHPNRALLFSCVVLIHLRVFALSFPRVVDCHSHAFRIVIPAKAGIHSSLYSDFIL